MKQEIQAGDVGTLLRITIAGPRGPINLSEATLKEILLRPPNGETLRRNADFVTDGSDGEVKYTTAAGDLDLPGRWRLQAHILAPGYDWHTGMAWLYVRPNLG